MGCHCHISAPLEVGGDVLFASYVSIVGDVWVGHGAILLHGIHIAAGVVAAGNPARVLRYRR